jgi:hypothetical protein
MSSTTALSLSTTRAVVALADGLAPPTRKKTSCTIVGSVAILRAWSAEPSPVERGVPAELRFVERGGPAELRQPEIDVPQPRPLVRLDRSQQCEHEIGVDRSPAEVEIRSRLQRSQKGLAARLIDVSYAVLLVRKPDADAALNGTGWPVGLGLSIRRGQLPSFQSGASMPVKGRPWSS